MGGLLIAESEGMNEYTLGSGDGASVSMGPLRGEPGGRTPLLGTLKDM